MAFSSGQLFGMRLFKVRTWAPSPSRGAVLVSADVSRLVRVVAAVVVEVAAPQDGDALAVAAGELGLGVASSVV